MELFKTTGVLDEMVLKEVAKKGILKFLVSCSASYSVLQDILRLQLFSFPSVYFLYYGSSFYLRE